MLRSIKTGRLSLLQYGPREVELWMARLEDINVRSIVELDDV